MDFLATQEPFGSCLEVKGPDLGRNQVQAVSSGPDLCTPYHVQFRSQCQSRS